MFLRQLGGLVVGGSAGRQITGFGRGPANDHAVQIIVVDHQEPRQRLPSGVYDHRKSSSKPGSLLLWGEHVASCQQACLCFPAVSGEDSKV
jgi:hypothetical protein